MIAKASEATNTTWKSFGTATPMIAKAMSGPISAPSVSSARWTPKARPSAAGGDDVAINASRGAVRSPLPSRSAVMTDVMAVRLVAESRKTR